jgi:hypothetical protein
MKTFACQCGNRLFFENVQCVACGRDVGWCEHCQRIASFTAEDNTGFRCHSCGTAARKCLNYEIEQVCNHFVTVPPESTEPSLCSVCLLTETIPDLTVEGNRDKWRRLEQAKRRLIYQLDLLNLPYRDNELPLSFDFKGNIVPAEQVWRKGEKAEHVHTGHLNGKITINIQEADDVERERLRVDMNEAQRTLIGHFRHEVGHYFWQLLIQGKREAECVKVFGDHNDPDYATALSLYYEQGPPPDWSQAFISAYAASHPWEDFAETFALYLDIRSVLDTAQHLGVTLPPITNAAPFQEYVLAYQKLGITVNELNRCLGIFDLVPEVIVQPVVEKLNFIHDLVQVVSSDVSIQFERPKTLEDVPVTA